MFEKKNLSDRMKEEAVSLGLCAQWTADWKDNSSKDEMVRKFVRGIDFCIAHDWPSVKVMRDCFGDVIHNHGVYADENVNLCNPRIVILNGECVANIEYDRICAGEIYVRHNCTLYLRAGILSKVTVNVYDNAKVHVKCDGAASCRVYMYGGSVNGDEDVIIRDRRSFKYK